MTAPGLLAHFLVFFVVVIVCSTIWPQANGQFFAGWLGGNIAMAITIFADRKYREASRSQP